MNSAPIGLARLSSPSICFMKQQETVLASLRRAAESQESFATLIGEPGTGKSYIGLRFLQSLADDVPRVMVQASPNMKPTELFQAILFDLGKPYLGLSEHEQRLAVTAEILNALNQGQTMVLLIDEAHHLLPASLEELRLLGNYQSAEAQALFVLLMGQPALRTRLNQPELAGFAQRIGVHAKLEALTPAESRQYLHNLVDRAQLEWDTEAVELIVRNTRGIPRLMNQVATLAQEFAHAEQLESIDVEVALVALQERGIESSDAESEQEAEADLPQVEIESSVQHSDVEELLPHPGQVPRPLHAKPSKSASRRKSA